MCNCKIRTLSLALYQFRIRNFREKQQFNGQDPAKQVYKIWRKNFQELLSNHISGVGSFFKAAPCKGLAYACILFMNYTNIRNS